jgi:hypothetical protein
MKVSPLNPFALHVFPILLLILPTVFDTFWFSVPSTTAILSVSSPTFASAYALILGSPKSSCPKCNFTPLNPVTSTRRDVVLGVALSAFVRVEYFLRTLRTTGTRARVILFLDSPRAAPPELLRFFTACDVEPVFINTNSSTLRRAPKLSRYYFYYQWLSAHLSEVDRVIHSDTFDVVFQSDPFIPALNASKMYFTSEMIPIRHSGWTASWIRLCYGRGFIAKHGREPVSCSGVTAGGGEVFLIYLRVLLNGGTWKECFEDSLDQAHHNWLLYTGAFQRAGLEIELLDCNSQFLTMYFCCQITKCHWDNVTEIIYGSNPERAPVVVHQYNRWKELTRRNRGFCPEEGFNDTKRFPMAELEGLPPIELEMELPS